MARIAAALLALTSLTAFAPAPFPRTPRRAPAELSLEAMGGLWTAVKFQSVTQGNGRSDIGLWFQQVRIKGDQWSYVVRGTDNPPYRIVVDATRKPATIDFYSKGRNDRPGMVGLVKREGNRVTILYYATAPQNRAAAFESAPPGWWVLTLERPN